MAADVGTLVTAEYPQHSGPRDKRSLPDNCCFVIPNRVKIFSDAPLALTGRHFWYLQIASFNLV